MLIIWAARAFPVHLKDMYMYCPCFNIADALLISEVKMLLEHCKGIKSSMRTHAKINLIRDLIFNPNPYSNPSL